MSDTPNTTPTPEVDLSAELNRLKADNEALEAKIKGLKAELNSKLFQQAKEDIAALNQELANYSERELAIMSDFSLALRHLNDSVSDLQAVLAVEKGEEEKNTEENA